MLCISPGAVIVIKNSVCAHGCILCVDACTPRRLDYSIIIFLVFSFLYILPCYDISFMYLIQDISGLLCMFVRLSHHQALFWDRWVNLD
jgi:hypothetical protein